MKDIRIYFEGDDRLRPGFREFFSEVIEAARRQKRSVLPIATNGTPVRAFSIAQRKHTDSLNLLLLDSEQALDGTGSRERELVAWGDGVFWMVELMESWFLADREAVKRYYNNDDRFQESSLPANAQVEKIPKRDVLDGLKEATRRTPKGRYHKTKHAPGILQVIDPGKVMERAPQCRRLFDFLNALLTDQGQ